MKPLVWLCGCLLLVTVGCGKKSGLDASPLQASFKSAEPATRSEVDKAAVLIKDGDYSTALAQLQRIGTRANLTPEQKQVVKDTMKTIQKQMAAVARKPST